MEIQYDSPSIERFRAILEELNTYHLKIEEKRKKSFWKIRDIAPLQNGAFHAENT